MFDLIQVCFMLDRWLQKRLRQVVPDTDEVWTTPGARLGREPIYIGPRQSYWVATWFGLGLGILFSCVFFFHEMICLLPGPRAAALVWPLVAVALCSLTAIVLIAYWLRGGTMLLRPEGLVLSYRKEQVFCPWALFQMKQRSWDANELRVLGDAWPEAIPFIICGRTQGIVATGKEVRTRPLYFSSNGKLVLRDLYAVRLSDLLRLLLHLGRRLGREQKLGSPPTCGDPLPVEMSH